MLKTVKLCPHPAFRPPPPPPQPPRPTPQKSWSNCGFLNFPITLGERETLMSPWLTNCLSMLLWKSAYNAQEHKKIVQLHIAHHCELCSLQSDYDWSIAPPPPPPQPLKKWEEKKNKISFLVWCKQKNKNKPNHHQPPKSQTQPTPNPPPLRSLLNILCLCLCLSLSVCLSVSLSLSLSLSLSPSGSDFQNRIKVDYSLKISQLGTLLWL